MAEEEAPPSSAAGATKGVKDALTRKMGPLPVWGWGVIAGVALLLVIRRRAAGTPTQASQAAVVAGQGSGVGSGGGGGGSGSGSGGGSGSSGAGAGAGAGSGSSGAGAGSGSGGSGGSWGGAPPAADSGAGHTAATDTQGYPGAYGGDVYTSNLVSQVLTGLSASPGQTVSYPNSNAGAAGASAYFQNRAYYVGESTGQTYVAAPSTPGTAFMSSLPAEAQTRLARWLVGISGQPQT